MRAREDRHPPAGDARRSAGWRGPGPAAVGLAAAGRAEVDRRGRRRVGFGRWCGGTLAASVATCQLACQPSGRDRRAVTRARQACARLPTDSEHLFGDAEALRCAPTPPPTPTAVLDDLLAEPSLARGVVHHAVIPPRERRPRADARLAGSADRGRARVARHRRLYRHQAEAIEAVHAGEDVVVVTPTASGKTLCYALPALQAIAEDPASRALFLFPTKALGQDQVTEFGELVRGGRPVDHHLDLRRRHARTDPLGRAGRRAGRRDQPGHAPLGDPAPPHEVVPAVRAAPAHRHRRAAHLSRRVRRPRRQRAAPAAADLRPLRQPPDDRVLLGDDREPRRARGDADRAPGTARRSERRPGRRAARPARRPAGARAGQRRARARP